MPINPLNTHSLTHLCTDHPKSTYYARITGSRMMRAGIHSGDIVGIDSAREPRPGEYVCVHIGGKGFTFRQWSPPYLLPLNPKATPILITSEMKLLVIGVVVSLIRRLVA